MTMTTEAQLWRTFEGAARGTDVELTRIETSTVVGVSDVEYVTPLWHGWIETKVALTKRDTTPLKCTHPLTLEQYGWIVRHHGVTRSLRSWVLIGLGGAPRWRGFLLVPAPQAWHVCGEASGEAQRPSLDELDKYRVDKIEDVIKIIWGDDE